MMSFVVPVLAGIGMIAVLVVIHEFGHFLLAKVFGIGVPVFSVGMGPRLFGVRFGDTDYRVSALPIGGYCQMAGADPFGEAHDESDVDPDVDFMKKPVWKRLIVMVAGPAFNLGLPFLLFTVVLMLGEPQPDAVVGTVMPGSPAERAGLMVDDRIVGVGGEPVEVWVDVVMALDRHAADAEIALDVVRDGAPRTLRMEAGSVVRTVDGLVDAERVGFWTARPSARIGVDDLASPAGVAGLRTGDRITAVNGIAVGTLYEVRAAMPGDGPHEVTYVSGLAERSENPTAEQLAPRSVRLERSGWTSDDPLQDPWGLLPVVLFVGSVSADSPAQIAGVQPYDRLVSVDDHPVRAWVDLVNHVAATVPEEGAAPRELTLVVHRDGAPQSLQFAPRIEREVVRGEVRYRPIMGVGIYPSSYVAGADVKKYYNVLEAIPRAVTEGVLVFKKTIGVLRNVLTGRLKPKESLGGPIEIFRQAGEAAERGIFDYARTIGIISFSLGIINLLPVPLLDGGQIVFFAIEGLRGRPLSLELRERVQMAGMLALGALFLLVSFNDVSRWLAG